ncbi:MurR/RpiR family transcriptional regulator [Solibacillus sp. FSL H8-0538]|uniref:MurR/RpiR family transcriptional regulator n=1 Tax=Solibacillus sp. FSL H8-0538 TaxID=2921400 RepID=UPI0030F85BC6
MSICDSIKKKYIRLSKGQRKVAQFVIDNPNVIASQVASEVGRLAGVSESTVIRFCYAIDLSGFSELQEKIRDFIVQNGGMPVPKRKVAAKKEKRNPRNDVMNQDISGISNTFQLIDENHFEEAVQLVHRAKKIHILGFRQSAPAAHWLYTNLSMLRNHVHFIPHDAEKIALQLALMDENSVLFVISLNEEYEDIITTVDIAKRKNVKIIAVRDQPLSTVQEQANVLLTVASVHDGGATCTIAVFSVLHALVECVVQQNKDQYETYRETYMDDVRQADQLKNIIAIS